MVEVPDQMAEDRAARRRIVQRATRYTVGLIVAAILIAASGSALIAWFVSRTGLPFRETWLALTVIVLLIPVIGIGVSSIRGWLDRRRGMVERGSFSE